VANMVGKEVGPYRILQKIAQGGMSSVYKGLHTGLEQDVAIKVLSPESFEDPCLRDRFISEAKIQARLSHPNVIKTLNYIEQDGTIFMVMEYINGESLDVLLKKIGTLPGERAVTIFMSVLEAIEFMHSKGIIHRDIKPANIMLSYDGYVKVMDFGIAKVMGENGKTKAGIRVGTLWYMSPEQIRGEEATALTDIYSLGVTLYQMLTGRVPFTGELEFDIMRGHLEQAPDQPCKINKDIKRELSEVILKAIAKKPIERYQSIREFSEALRSVMRSPGPDETRVFQMPEAPSERPIHGRYSSSKKRAVFAILVAAVIVSVSAIFIMQGKGSDTDTSSPAVQVDRAVLPQIIRTEKNAEASSGWGGANPQPAQRDAEIMQKKAYIKKAALKKSAVAEQNHPKPADTGNVSLKTQTPLDAPRSEEPRPDENTGWSIRK
jgi:eukaryotic-like serine/threonine-protein kinase